MTDITEGFKGNALRWIVVKNRHESNDVKHHLTPKPHHPPTLHVSHPAVCMLYTIRLEIQGDKPQSGHFLNIP